MTIKIDKIIIWYGKDSYITWNIYNENDAINKKNIAIIVKYFKGFDLQSDLF